MKAIVKFLFKCFNFLTKGLDKKFNGTEFDKQYNRLNLPIKLIMHGIPEDIVDRATYAQQLVLLEIVKDDIKEQINIQANAVNIGVYGSNKS